MKNLADLVSELATLVSKLATEVDLLKNRVAKLEYILAVPNKDSINQQKEIR